MSQLSNGPGLLPYIQGWIHVLHISGTDLPVAQLKPHIENRGEINYNCNTNSYYFKLCVFLCLKESRSDHKLEQPHIHHPWLLELALHAQATGFVHDLFSRVLRASFRWMEFSRLQSDCRGRGNQPSLLYSYESLLHSSFWFDPWDCRIPSIPSKMN